MRNRIHGASWVEGLSTLPRECADETPLPPPGQDAVGKPTSGLHSHQACTLRNHWRHAWFSDESRFLLQPTEEDGFTDGVVSDMRLRAWMRRLLMTVVASLFGEPSATQAGVSWFESKAT